MTTKIIPPPPPLMGKKSRFRNAKSTFAVLPNLLFFARRGFPPPSVYSAMWQIGSNKSRVRNGRIGGGREGFFSVTD